MAHRTVLSELPVRLLFGLRYLDRNDRPRERVPAMTPTPDTTPAAVDAMIEYLLGGVPAIGLDHDNGIELFDVERASETMFEAAAMLREVVRENERLAKAWHAKHAYQVKEARAHREYYEKSQVRMHELAAEAAALREALMVAAEALSQEQFHGNLPRENCFLCAAFETVVAALKEKSDEIH